MAAPTGWPRLLAFAVAGAATGLLLLVFQPLVAIGLAVLLPTLAVVRGPARRLAAFGVGVLVVTAGLLVPVLLGGDDDTGSGTDRSSEEAPGR